MTTPTPEQITESYNMLSRMLTSNSPHELTMLLADRDRLRTELEAARRWIRAVKACNRAVTHFINSGDEEDRKRALAAQLECDAAEEALNALTTPKPNPGGEGDSTRSAAERAGRGE